MLIGVLFIVIVIVALGVWKFTTCCGYKEKEEMPEAEESKKSGTVDDKKGETVENQA